MRTARSALTLRPAITPGPGGARGAALTQVALGTYVPQEDTPRGHRGGRPTLVSTLTDRRMDVALGNQNKVKYMATQLLAKFEENAPPQSVGVRRQVGLTHPPVPDLASEEGAGEMGNVSDPRRAPGSRQRLCGEGRGLLSSPGRSQVSVTDAQPGPSQHGGVSVSARRCVHMHTYMSGKPTLALINFGHKNLRFCLLRKILKIMLVVKAPIMLLTFCHVSFRSFL